MILAVALAFSVPSPVRAADAGIDFPPARLGIGLGGGWSAAWNGQQKQTALTLSISGEWALDDDRQHSLGIAVFLRDFTQNLESGPFGNPSPVFDFAIAYRWTPLGDRARVGPFGRVLIGIALQQGCGELCGDGRYWITSGEAGLVLRTTESIALALSGTGTIQSGAPLGFVPWAWQAIIGLTLFYDPGGAPFK